MGREFELKYAADDAAFAGLLARYPGLVPIAMETTYYDDPRGQLSARRWTLRRRLENGTAVCTLKIPLPDGSRGEWETECGEIGDAIPQLLMLGAPAELALFTAGGLTVSCGARFIRLAGPIELEDATAELALDRGVLLGGGKEAPLQEVEVELKTGSEDAIRHFARTLAAEFRLAAEPRSKVARARALAEER